MISDVLLLYYGDIGNERFQSALEHFEIKNAKVLKHCKDNLRGTKCLEELKSVLKNHSKSLVLILKSGNALINASPHDLLHHFNAVKKNKGKIFCNIHSDEDYGLNIISGNSKALQEAIEVTLARKEPMDLATALQSSIDVDEQSLTRIDSWNLNQTSSTKNIIGIKTRIMSTKDARMPLVLLQRRNTRDKFDYMLNLLESHDTTQSLKMPAMHDKKLHICMIIPTQSLFVEEFIHFFDSQEYERSQMSLQILVQTSQLEAKVSKIMSTTSFHG